MRRVVVDRGEQVLSRSPPDVLQAHVDAGQRGVRTGHHGLPVVETDQRDVIRHPVAEQAQALGETERAIWSLRRGLFRREYEGKTLRENLGLPRPENQFFRAVQRAAE